MKLQALCVLAMVPLGACAGPAMLGQSRLPGLYDPGPTGSSSDLDGPWQDAARGRPAGGWDAAAADSQLVDWGVFDAREPGVPQVGPPTHGVEPTESGRLYILELYQGVLDDRDALSLEVAGLSERFELALARIQGLELSEAASEARAQELEASTESLAAENRDLAARLTTAQIRRLEAEKLLLEAKIDWQHAYLDQRSSEASGSSTEKVALGGGQ
ncbi:MAG: hypothetical protein O7B99_07170 [Planctomycetota bacterium]|nr:hypothetical protein [Planctomycetota bacterium]